MAGRHRQRRPRPNGKLADRISRSRGGEGRYGPALALGALPCPVPPLPLSGRQTGRSRVFVGHPVTPASRGYGERGESWHPNGPSPLKAARRCHRGLSRRLRFSWPRRRPRTNRLHVSPAIADGVAPGAVWVDRRDTRQASAAIPPFFAPSESTIGNLNTFRVSDRSSSFPSLPVVRWLVGVGASAH